jgi:iron complex transport system substrate-binding protein
MTDMAGRHVDLPEHVERVVALSPSAIEFALALGVTVVGRPADATGAPGASTIGPTISPDFNAIAALHPDLVVADAAYHASRLKDFDRFPYPVFVLRAASYDDVLATVTDLGEATGRADRAVEVTSAITARVASVLERVRGALAPSVLILTGAGRDVYAGSDATYLGSLVAKLGGRNVLGAAPEGAPIAGFGLVEINQIAVKNPDVVLVIPSGPGGLAAAVRASPAWANSSAVKAGRVFELDTATFLRSPGPGVADALDQLARLLYPDRP